jgi:hypothetical protein
VVEVVVEEEEEAAVERDVDKNAFPIPMDPKHHATVIVITAVTNTDCR